jgi:hypothetical protein
MSTNNADMSSEFTGFFFFVLLILGVWLSGWVPFRTELPIYTVDCASVAQDGSCKPRDEFARPAIVYRPEKETMSVVVWTDGQAPFKYGNCAIVDTMNWACPSEYDPHHMVDGVLDDRTDNLGYPHLVRKWEWWLAKLKKM